MAAAKTNFCNICNREIDFIAAFYRPKGGCPGCGSLERHRAVALHIWHYLPMLVNKSVLHFAPETSLRKIITSVPVNYVPASYNPETKAGIDIRNIPFPDKTFNMIILNQLLEHIDDDRRAMAELYRVCAPGGKVIITVPLVHQYQNRIYKKMDGTVMPHLDALNEDSTFEVKDMEPTPDTCFKLYGQENHLRIYGRGDLKKRLENAGFNVEIFAAADYPQNFRDRLAIIDDVIVCTRPE